MTSVRYRSIAEIKETLQFAKSEGHGCTLLLGAGCSVTAGIPAAAGIVDIIKKDFAEAYKRAVEKTYAQCMAELLLDQRRKLIARYVDKAQINWAHLCLALLIQEGYVTRVLTTNFDPLVVRACAALGVFPAVYDFASSQLLKRADVPDQAVFYLHGQRTGFVLMNTDEDMRRHSKLLGPVFEDAGTGRPWVVVGYSGENDPVFQHLADVSRFDNGLFWVGYRANEPAPHLREQLLGQDKDAFFTSGFDADSFFVALTRELGIFPPDLVARPFSYLERALTGIAPFTEPGESAGAFENDVLRAPRAWIRDAISQFEQPAWKIITQGAAPELAGPQRALVHTAAARYLLVAGRYPEVLNFRKEYDTSPSPEFADVLSIAYVMQGNALLDQAKASASGDAAAAFFEQAQAMYKEALVVKPDRSEAFHNWGNLLLDQAKRATPERAASLFDAAEDKYKAALAIDPARSDVLANWGNLLLDRAKACDGVETSRQLWSAAEDKYRAALAIKPDLPAVLLSLGNVYLDRGKSEHGAEAVRSFRAAEAQYQAAIERHPNSHDAFALWGNVLLDLAKNTPGSEADALFDEAEAKFGAALAIKPDMSDAFTNWGNLLLERANRHEGLERDRLFAASEAKHLQALALRPDTPSVLYNLANVYRDWSCTKSGDDSRALADKERDAVRRAGQGQSSTPSLPS